MASASMRVKSQWFRSETPKTATEIAGAAAFIIFRIAQNSLKNMRKAAFELPPGATYFAFLAEFLAFLTLIADRIAHGRGDEPWRIEFTTALANRVGAFLADNEASLLGVDSVPTIKRRFVALVNERSADYSDCRWTDDGPDYAFLRCLGHRVAEVMARHEQTWAVTQVIDSEAPEATETLQRAMAGLLDDTPRPRRGGSVTRGE
jgi:hypothetical protein